MGASGILLLTLALVWPASGARHGASPAPTSPTPASPVADPPAPVDAAADPADAVAQADPTVPRLSIALDRSAARNGERVTATVILENQADRPILLRCGRPIHVWADITNLTPPPRDRWAVTDPWRRGMRRALLGDARESRGPLAVALEQAGRARPCTEGAVELAAGETWTTTFPWVVGYGDGSALHGPDDAPLVVRAQVVPVERNRRGVLRRADGPAITAATPLSVTSARNRRILPPARAIQRLFEDPAAAAWLDLEHASTWRRAEMRLSRGRWLFEVRRIATGCCPERLTAAVDARDGRVLDLDAPTLRWSAARAALESFETLELRLELQRGRFRDSRATRLRVTVTNLDDEDDVWFWSHDNDCTLQPGLFIAAGPEVAGARQRGKLGAFKRRALRGELIIATAGPPTRHQCRQPEPIRLGPLESVTRESFFRPGLVPTGQRTLQAVGRIDLVGPDPDTVGAWKVYASPAVRARFRTGDGSQQIPSPSALIDAALSDRRFARAIRAAPYRRWRDAGVTGTSVWLELSDGTRIVGLP